MSPLLLRQILPLEYLPPEVRLKLEGKKLMEGLQPKVGEMPRVSWSASPSCPRGAKQHQSQIRGSIWMPSDPEPRTGDPRHEPGLGRVSLDLGPAWKG